MAFLRAARKDEIPVGAIREYQVDGKTVALANVDGTFYAIDNVCLHHGGPLGGGVLNGKAVTCPWHGWEYNVTSGKMTQNPAVSVNCYKLQIRGEDIFVDCD